MAYQEQQQWQQALDAYELALKLYEQHGQQHESGDTYYQIGMVYEEQGELPSACVYYHRALAAERALDPPNPEETTNNPSRAPTRQLRPTKPPIAAAPLGAQAPRPPCKCAVGGLSTPFNQSANC